MSKKVEINCDLCGKPCREGRPIRATLHLKDAKMVLQVLVDIQQVHMPPEGERSIGRLARMDLCPSCKQWCIERIAIREGARD